MSWLLAPDETRTKTRKFIRKAEAREKADARADVPFCNVWLDVMSSINPFKDYPANKKHNEQLNRASDAKNDQTLRFWNVHQLYQHYAGQMKKLE